MLAVRAEFVSVDQVVAMGRVKRKTLRPSLIRRIEGFTLNEVLISIVLITIGILGFSLNTIGVFRGGYASGNITIATNLAQDKMEQLKARGSALPNCPTATTDGCFDGPLNAQGGSAQPGMIYSRFWIITPNSPEAGLTKINVTASWTDNMPHQVTLSTLVFTG